MYENYDKWRHAFIFASALGGGSAITFFDDAIIEVVAPAMIYQREIEIHLWQKNTDQI